MAFFKKKKSKNEGARNFEKYAFFCKVHLSTYKKHNVVKPRLKQHAFLVDPLGVSYDFSNTPTLIF